MADFYCEKCNRTMNENQFYGSNNLEKYPTGKLNQCKKCISMHVDNWKPETYLWILQEADVPYIPDEWNKLLATYGKDPTKLTGVTILGRYLAKMRLKQHKNYRWKDSEYLQQLANNKIETTMRRQGFDEQQITDAITKATFDMPEEPLVEPELPQQSADPRSGIPGPSPADYFGDGETANLDLSEEDITYLRLKWGKTYKPEEWVQLEQLYNDMMESYDIQTAGHIDTLKFICKTSLKANQLIDIGDIEGFQKMSKVYDQLMKAGRFTAAQNKADQGEFIDSIGELVAICETEGFIPRYYISEPNDKVDATIQDMQRYTSKLVREETNLSQLMEEALRTIQKEDEASEDEDDGGFSDIDEVEQELRAEDYEEFNDFLDEQADIDDQLLTSFLQSDDYGT